MGTARTPTDFYRFRKNRVAAIKWLVEEKLRKGSRDVTQADFHSNRLRGLLTDYYDGSPYYALKDAGYKTLPWERDRAPQNFYKLEKNRTTAAKFLAARLRKVGIPPRNARQDDFYANGLAGLLTYHNGSPYAAFREAGIVAPKDESYMRRHGHARFKEAA
jgi:hypothetical protein